MKYLNRVLAASAAISVTLFFSACWDNVTKVTEVTEVRQASVNVVSSEKDIPDCDKDNNGSFVITEDEKDVYVCYSEKWYVLNGKDGSTTAVKDGSNGKNGADGKKGADGNDGADGASCSGVAFDSGDSTGFKIVCGTDTLGVILNGKNGKNGRHGLVPGLAKKLVKRMSRGINTSVFASPLKNHYSGFDDNEVVSDWALWHDLKNYDKLEKKHFKMIADKGFDHIRIQVRWDTHFTGDSSKCEIDPDYMRQVKWAVENTIANGMIAVVNEHYLLYQMPSDNLNFDGNGYDYDQVSPCEKAIFKQMAMSMSEYSPDSLIIELPNEPNLDKYITAKQWNDLADSLIKIVHGIDPARVIIVGSRNFYSKDYLNELKLDNSDGLLMASFHYYDPFGFTSGNCPTATKPDTSKCGNEKWEGTRIQKALIYDDFSNVAAWSKANGNIPIYLGEYGTSYYTKDSSGAEKWLAAITQTADEFGFATAMHNFAGDYYVYYLRTDKWVDFKLRALFNPKDKFTAPDRPDLDTVSKTTVLENFGEDFPISKLSSDLENGEKWGFYNSCNGKTSCDTMVTTNEGGTRSESAALATFKTNDGHNGAGLYMKHVAKAPKNVYPYFAMEANLAPTDEDGLVYFDFSKMDAISFYAKGQGRIKLVLYTAYSDSVAKVNKAEWAAGFHTEFGLTDEWQHYVVWPDALVPERFSKLDTLGGEWEKAKDRVYKIGLKNGSDVVPEQTTTVEWYVDDIIIHGLELEDFE
ncbi:MAG: glycoside hydrolase family 5 protein [Fibrobacter sp.]|nr:glycoside hydrolase family 5 protein [Fibrobacter sp.]